MQEGRDRKHVELLEWCAWRVACNEERSDHDTTFGAAHGRIKHAGPCALGADAGARGLRARGDGLQTRDIDSRCAANCAARYDAAMNLIYIADPMCSWCYGFGKSMDALLAQPGEFAPLQLALVMGGLRPYTTETL